MHHTLSLFLLLPLFAHAQDPLPVFQDDHLFGAMYWASAADSVDFTAFRSALQLTDPSQDGDTTSVTYRLVWRIAEHGGIAAMTAPVRRPGRPFQLAGPAPAYEPGLSRLGADHPRAALRRTPNASPARHIMPAKAA